MRFQCLYLPGSVRQKAAMCSPEDNLGRYFCFWASFPAIRIPWNTKQLSANHTEASPYSHIVRIVVLSSRNTFPPDSSHQSYTDDEPIDEKRFSSVNYFIFTFSPMAWCAASVTAIEPSNEMISARRAYMVLDNPRPPGMKRKTTLPSICASKTWWDYYCISYLHVHVRDVVLVPFQTQGCAQTVLM